MRRSLAVAGLVVGGLALSPEVDAAAVPAWTVIELQGLEDGNEVRVSDINNSGMSVGEDETAGMAVRWDGLGNPTALTSPEGCEAFQATSIADSGHIAGRAWCGDHVGAHHRVSAVQWAPDGTPTTDERTSHFETINADGVVVGVAFDEADDSDRGRAFAYLPGYPLLELPDAGAPQSVAFDVTDWGYAVGGVSGVPTLPQDVAVGWYGDQVFPLLNTSESSAALAVNEYGVALVQTYGAEDLSGRRNYLVAPGGRVVELDDSGDHDIVNDLNDASIAVGIRITDDVDEGRFYVGSQSIGLAELVSEADAAEFGLAYPLAVNNQAWVVGHDGAGTAWLLKPPAAS